MGDGFIANVIAGDQPNGEASAQKTDEVSAEQNR